eukprot:snap_masked-scaffold_84-processed-gene-0.6-mRNA-1 protein AED:1.00 eAED:1.00 QI:0/0/0/0/1/1/2/0/82
MKSFANQVATFSSRRNLRIVDLNTKTFTPYYMPLVGCPGVEQSRELRNYSQDYEPKVHPEYHVKEFQYFHVVAEDSRVRSFS